MISEVINFRSAKFVTLCRQHKVKSLFVFGSVATGKFTQGSDIDLLVEINEPDPLNRGELLLSFWNKVEDHFNRKIDLLTASSLRNPYLIESINQTKKLVYNGSEEEIL